ncbi:MAG: hypothetical protein R3D55_24970 [Chloroflexota bacterium]
MVDLATAVSPPPARTDAYHHLPVFHTEHCVFAASSPNRHQL